MPGDLELAVRGGPPVLYPVGVMWGMSTCRQANGYIKHPRGWKAFGKKESFQKYLELSAGSSRNFEFGFFRFSFAGLPVGKDCGFDPMRVHRIRARRPRFPDDASGLLLEMVPGGMSNGPPIHRSIGTYLSTRVWSPAICNTHAVGFTKSASLLPPIKNLGQIT